MTRVSIVTRTKNRPLLLRRCVDTLLRQDCRALEWVLVNDAGDQPPVEEVAALARAGGLATQVIHRAASCGIAAAANNGLAHARGEFIHLHDDDDSVEPAFYQQVIEFLDAKPQYMGVVASANLVQEFLQGGQMVRLSARRLFDPDGAIYLSDMFNSNLFTTIAFVYRRAVLEQLGCYDETLPVLEDWDFNLRFLRRFDIGGTNAALANYHWRTPDSAAGTPQTVVSGSALHREYTALIRNRMLREGLDAGAVSPGLLAAQGRNHQLSADVLRLINDRTTSMLKVRAAVKRFLSLGKA
jgi:glycosyltransferase involved in cell wall biosynthesis